MGKHHRHSRCQATGAHTAVLTNSAGGLNPAFSPGDLMVLNDHINLSGRNLLFGPHDNRLGPRFPDITDAYDPELRDVALNTAKEIGLPLHEGVYTWMLGPSYESPAEIRMLKTLGADAVGMSTVPETIVARQMGMRVLAFSCISNLAAGISPTPLTHEEVQEVSGGASERFSKLILQALKNLLAKKESAHKLEAYLALPMKTFHDGKSHPMCFRRFYSQ